MASDLISRRAGDSERRTLWQRIKDVALQDVAVLARGGVDATALERLEQLLLEADFGVPVTVRLVDEVKRRAARGEVRSAEEFRTALADLVRAALTAGAAAPDLLRADTPPTVTLVLGVNGVGKTTTIGKLAARFRGEGRRVLLGAADTFRAGAIDQLRLWAERTNAEFVGATPGGDPAAVAFQAIDAALTRNCDDVIIDTAGRLHTSQSLMQELEKVHRVVSKRLAGAPHEVLLVLDGTAGQNAVQQAKTFAAAVPVTGVAITKLDGSARGGIVVAVHEAINVPVKLVGVGEGLGDLRDFDAAAYAAQLLAG